MYSIHKFIFTQFFLLKCGGKIGSGQQMLWTLLSDRCNYQLDLKLEVEPELKVFIVSMYGTK